VDDLALLYGSFAVARKISDSIHLNVYPCKEKLAEKVAYECSIDFEHFNVIKTDVEQFLNGLNDDQWQDLTKARLAMNLARSFIPRNSTRVKDRLTIEEYGLIDQDDHFQADSVLEIYAHRLCSSKHGFKTFLHMILNQPLNPKNVSAEYV